MTGRVTSHRFIALLYDRGGTWFLSQDFRESDGYLRARFIELRRRRRRRR